MARVFRASLLFRRSAVCCVPRMVFGEAIRHVPVFSGVAIVAEDPNSITADNSRRALPLTVSQRFFYGRYFEGSRSST